MEYPDDDEQEMSELDTVASAQPEPELPRGTITVSINLDQYLAGGTLEEMICKSITSSLHNSIKPVIEKKVQEVIAEAAKEQFRQKAEALLVEYFNKPHRKTDTWGNKTGVEISLQDIFADLFKQYLGQRVDDKGSETTYSGNTDRVSWMVRTIAIAPLNTAIKAEVEKISGQAKLHVQGAVMKYITEQLVPTLPTVPLILEKS